MNVKVFLHLPSLPVKELLQIYNPFAKTDDLQNDPIISTMPVRLYQ